MKRLEKTFIFLQGAQLIYIKKSTHKPYFWSLLPKVRLVLLINGFRNIKKFEIKFDKTIDVVVKYTKDFGPQISILYGSAVKEGKP